MPRRCIACSPNVAEFSTSPSSTSTLSASLATAAANGLPPYVEPWSPGPKTFITGSSARIAETGPSRIIRGAFMEGLPFEKNNEHRWRVFDGNRQVGEVSSAVHSPRLARNIGFVLADIAAAAIGTKLRVETPEGDRALEITTLPFIDPDKKIPRAPLR